MAISVAVPKDLSGIKTKVALNLTQRQIVCFGSAALVAAPVYFVARAALGTQGALILMMAAAMPSFFLAMYEKDGFPAEKIVYFMIRQKLLAPGIRRYRSGNIYTQMDIVETKREEAERVVRENKKDPLRGRKA